ncbi:MAG: ATP-dependent zinc metalloprotease FtsH [Anaerolineae bacterium]
MRRNPQKSNGGGLLSRLSQSGCSVWQIVFWVALILLIAPWVSNMLGGASRTPVTYTFFKNQVRDGNVEQITVTGQQIEGSLEEPAPYEVSAQQTVTVTNFSSYMPSFGDEDLMPLLEEQNVEVRSEPPSDFPWGTILISAIPTLLMLGLAYLFIRRMQGGGQNILSMRESGAQLYDRRQEHTTFDDVAGARGAKAELREVIEFLKNPEQFQRLGGEMPKGVLLVGPPGTGKTLLARAVAGEADVPFFSITGSNFMEMFVGVGASRVRDLFEDAKKASPSIIFIDELDSIGRRRGAGLGGGHDEREQTLNQLLAELDGFAPKEDVIVMAATNRPDILDRALLRPGRFDRRITVDLPSMRDRVEILKIHARDKPLSDDVDLERVARGTPGFSGADLENLLNEAALLAARRGAEEVESRDIEQARDKILMGLERENVAMTEEECKTLAYHEAGHAIVAAVLPDTDPIHKVSIVPRGKAMGVTQQLPRQDRYIYPREYMLSRLSVMMGGRAAENIVLGTSTSGAADDLKQATRLARRMVLEWGMSEKFGHFALGGAEEQVFLGEQIAQRREYSEETQREADEEIKSILRDAYQQAFDVLKEHREKLDQLAGELREREEIPGDEVLELLGLAQKEEESL